MPHFCALFSGSSGNCIYVESEGSAILIDAGVSLKAIKQALGTIGAELASVKAVFITHEHSDHIRGLPVMASKLDIPIYANAGTIRGILDSSPRVPEHRLTELSTGAYIELKGMQITSFETSHDSNESVGYTVHTHNGHSFAVATDLGVVDASVAGALRGCEIVMLEANHDTGMLRNGNYPYFLKKRILSEKGHLSNEGCAAELPSLLEAGTRCFILAHLSFENNLPELAVATAVCALTEAGAREGCDYTVEAAPRSGPGRLYQL